MNYRRTGRVTRIVTLGRSRAKPAGLGRTRPQRGRTGKQASSVSFSESQIARACASRAAEAGSRYRVPESVLAMTMRGASPPSWGPKRPCSRCHSPWALSWLPQPPGCPPDLGGADAPLQPLPLALGALLAAERAELHAVTGGRGRCALAGTGRGGAQRRRGGLRGLGGPCPVRGRRRGPHAGLSW